MLMPSAMPRSLAGKASVMIAAELAISIEPPTAWTTRQPISQSAPWPPLNGSRDRMIEQTAKIAKPRLYSLTRPYMSPSRPSVTTSTAVTSM